MSRLYIIPDINNIEKSLAIADRFGAGFEYNDFSSPAVLDDEDECSRRIGIYKSLDRDRSRDTSHGAFLDVTVHSEDRLIREASDRRVRQSMEIAKEMGIRGVVFHTNLVSNLWDPVYRENWLDRNEAYWRKLTAAYPGLTVFMENMFEDRPEMLAQLAARLEDVENFSVCFDYAHAHVFGNGSAEWVQLLVPLAAHMHINDNDGKVDLHLAVGDGKTDWRKYNTCMRSLNCRATVLVEMLQPEMQIRSLEYMQANHIYPFE